MAAKLGTADVSFRLGAGEVAAVYLGSQEVWSAGGETGGFNFNPNNLVLVYDTSLEPADNTVSVPINNVAGGGSPNVTIDWGDGTTSTATTNGFVTKTYAAAGVYVVQISGTMTTLNYGIGGPATNNKAKLVRCLSFGNVGLTSLLNAFRSCQNLIEVPLAVPATVTNMSGMFNICTAFNQNIGGWNTANVRNMSNTFRAATSFNQDIGGWNTASVTDMFAMFQGATSFNQDIGGWNISSLAEDISLANFMLGVTLGTTNYDAILIGWEANKASYRSDLTPNFGSSKYTAGSAAATARAALVTYGWTITDGGTA
jgi:surface protein